MWSLCFNLEKTQRTDLMFTEYFYSQAHFGRRASTRYKNRFLVQQQTFVEKTVNLFVFKGSKLKFVKLFQYASLAFFWNVKGVRAPIWFTQHFNYFALQGEYVLKPEVQKLFKNSDLFLNLNTLVPFFITPNLPMVKGVCFARKHLKKKKSVKKKLAKYTVKYFYVPHTQRMAVAARWFGMLTKVTHKPLINNFLDVCVNVTLDDNASYLIKLRNQVYAGLAAEHD